MTDLYYKCCILLNCSNFVSVIIIVSNSEVLQVVTLRCSIYQGLEALTGLKAQHGKDQGKFGVRGLLGIYS